MSTPDSEQSTSLEFISERWRVGFLRNVLYVTTGIGFVAVLLYALTSDVASFTYMAIGFYIVLLAFTFLPVPYNVRAGFFLLLLNLMSVLTLLDTGVMGSALLFFLGTSIFSILIFSPRVGMINSLISMAIILLVGWLSVSGRLVLFSGPSFTGTTTNWIQSSAYFILLTTIAWYGIRFLKLDFIKIRGQAGELLNSLALEQSHLSDRVEERTSELSQRTIDLEKANQVNLHRASQFEAISQVTGAISVLRTSAELLEKVTQLIGRQFNFHHVGIFMNDPANEFTFLSAANSESGQKLMKVEYHLKIGEGSIVGIVARTGIPRIAQSNNDIALLLNPSDLPGTLSEIALPLKSTGRIIGVLDIHSTQDAAFSREDIRIFSILADQVSLALENVQLFEQTNRSLVESESLYRQYIRQEWERLPAEQDLSGYRYSVQGSTPLTELGDANQDEQRVKIPLILRGESIGLLAIKMPGAGALDPDQKELIESIADRVALALENARLFEDSSRRASKERAIGEITSKIGASINLENILKTAVEELGHALPESEVVIQLEKPENR
jgi:GAF domain-containing protein